MNSTPVRDYITGMTNEYQISDLTTDPYLFTQTRCYTGDMTHVRPIDPMCSLRMPANQVRRLAHVATPYVSFFAREILGSETALEPFLQDQQKEILLREQYPLLQEAFDKYKALVALLTE